LPYSNFWTNFFSGGSPTLYNNTWYDATYSDLFPGTSLSGFVVGIPDISPPSQVAWFAFSATTTFDPADMYTGSEAFLNDLDQGIAGFEGVASAPAASVPEPSPSILMLSASAVMMVLRRFRRRP
jgi:hypothetical protein